MPELVLHETWTVPFVGWSKLNVYGPAPEPDMSWAGTPSMSKSLALIAPIGSLNKTLILVSEVNVAFGTGSIVVTVGGTVSWKVYCHIDPAASPSNGFGGESRLEMP